MKRLLFEVIKNQELRIKILTMTTMIYNFVWAICKIIFGICMSAYLFCISGIYNILIGFAKKTFLSNRNRSTETKTKCIVIGILILIAGIVYSLYTASFLIFPKDGNYGLILSIAIASCSFLELGISIYNIIKARRNNDDMLYSLRCCSLVTACFAIVLTQVALLSATNTINVSIFNSISGILAGTIAIIIGINIIIKSSKKHKI